MKLIHWLFLGALLSPTLCRAQAGCPWINAVTATDAPSGSSVPVEQITVSVHECLFHYQDGSVAYELRVTVEDAGSSSKNMERKEAKCTSKAIPIPGLGNEAVLCGADMRSSHGEQVIGRVRDTLFIIIASTGTGHFSPTIRKLLCDKAQSGAEQVAGNLF